MKKSIVLVGVVVALMMMALPMVSAQEATLEATATVVITETEINDSFWVSNPANRNLSDVYVDLQAENDGQVAISAVYTWRARGGGTKSADVVAVYAPQLSNGRLSWRVVSITADGKPASADIVAQINTHLSASWRRWIADQIKPGRLTDVSISDEDITFTFASRL